MKINRQLDSSMTPARPDAAPDAAMAPDAFVAAERFFDARQGLLFVTGRAGTGKSTLLRRLKDREGRNCAVVAPTGLAAVNAGGQTIHSFFKFPPRLIEARDIRKSANARVMRSLDCLIIDEVSMVRADLMHGIDRALRINRERPREPFGGVQVMLFGDVHQLAPVVQRELHAHFEESYGGIYFFNAPVFRETGGDMLELTRVFRQTDAHFVALLNAVREGRPDRETFEALNARVMPLDAVPQRAKTVILTPTNQVAFEMNRQALSELKGSASAFEAQITGQFEESAYPTDRVLFLKPGAKVVLLRNDPKGRWVNGTLAEVVLIKGGTVHIAVDDEVHELEPVTWEALRYAVGEGGSGEGEGGLKSETVGKFRQLPIRLAWAMTIHKAQGLTLESVYLDMGRGSFAHGQTYVALSRARSLEGLALARPLRRADIVFDEAALRYRQIFTARRA
jgi:ATP-dependent DNA helicase PIF1